MKRLIVLALIVPLALAACAQRGVQKIKDVEFSGFLGDYSQLRPGGKERASYYYIKPNLNLAKYDKILLDPPVIFRGKESQTRGISPQDTQRLLNNFHKLLYASLSKDYQIVQVPGPSTMRFQAAITKVKESDVGLDAVSSVVPPLHGITALVGYATGKPVFQGEAIIEAKITDSATRELLAAGVDSRVGGKKLSASTFNSWGDVNQIMEFWAKGIAYRLCKERGGTGCKRPRI